MPVLVAAILVRLALADGSVIECETDQTVEYAPDARMLLVAGCSDGIFGDGFEEDKR